MLICYVSGSLEKRKEGAKSGLKPNTWLKFRGCLGLQMAMVVRSGGTGGAKWP